MFIDNECCSYLKENPLYSSINKYKTKIFSQNTKEEFINYLNDVELKTPKEHFDKINEVYGIDWREPFTELYRKDKQ